MKENSVLTLLGFSAEESRVYEALCAEHPLTIAGIARKTGLHRPRLYKLLPDLVENNIVTERKIGKRTYYRPVEPRQLYTKLKAHTDSLMEQLDTLQGSFEETKQKPDVTFRAGTRAGGELFDDIADVLPKGGVIHRYSARRLDNKDFPPSAAYMKRREQGHFERLVITSESRAATKHKRLDRLVKVVPESFDLFDDDVSQMMYEDRTVIIDHEHNSIFTIRSEKIANFQRKLFTLLWRHLPDPKRMKER